MDFSLDSTQVALVDSLRRYLEAEVAPLVEAHEAEKRPVPRHIVAAMRDYGLIGGLLPESEGGFGLSMTTYGALIAEVARVWPSLRGMLSVSNLAATALARAGSAELREKYLPRILSGEAICCFALSEPNIGSDAANVETRAERTASGGWRINGRKIYITNGPICDLGIVFVNTPLEDGSRGVTCLVFEKSMPGVSCTPLGKMGMHCSPLGELLFEDVEVPAENIVGEVGGGFAIAKRYLNAGRSVVGFAALGIAQASLDAAIRFAKDRVQFGRPIGSFQLVQQMIADMMTQVEAARLLCYRSADALDRNDSDNRILCSMAKRYASDAALRVAETALQVHGGAGYTTLFPVERYYRDARHLSIGEGTNQILAMVMAQDELGLSALR
ncbi:acyl-CoA dehydrogenase MmgC (plasmid) [Cupriavidus necator N-1]|uniref:3-sulfinopropanoyl-CoA desulfinase n=1 Tax=Cupriavidus necator (strain ATCC 43291 / DSM 13513 / CCUG 52238 / LMG 8453 / N-1) TaxID=1042878 RepID=F8GV31_CUPNN|nr:acyl-CoA dehydrogenase family protein [Cupriavidus necator]AEI81458.1 acyl-CoA dehydrogenase MmgC [Cupriavidus necator N-1]KJK13504.1 acyl-CoA dehydrogenase [Burkholderiaceae bacterium 16]MDX6007835.1 acyl-CoA dehydrogenase family protein [Cupriavidus necator]